MDKPISVGDLVQIVKPKPCCGQYSLGFIFRVESINLAGWFCSSCGFSGEDPCALYSPAIGVGIARLKRIPPYDQLEHFRSEELLRRDVKVKA